MNFEKQIGTKKYPMPSNSDDVIDVNPIDISLIEAFKNRLKRNTEKETRIENSNKKI